MKRFLVVGAVTAALALVLSVTPASASSLTDPCTLGDGSFVFDGPVGTGAVTPRAPSVDPVPPNPSASVDPPGVDQAEPSVTFIAPGVSVWEQSGENDPVTIVGTHPFGYAVNHELDDVDGDGIPGVLMMPEPETNDPDGDGIPGSPPVPTVTQIDHDEDGIVDAVSVDTGAERGSGLEAGSGPTLEGIETHGSAGADPGSTVDTGGVSTTERAGSYTYEAPISCDTDWGVTTGTLSVGKVLVAQGVKGEAVGTVACGGGEANGQAVIEFTEGVMAGNAFLSTWHTKWLANVQGGVFEADGTFQYRGVVTTNGDGDEEFSPLVPLVGGYTGTLTRKAFTTDPDEDGPEKSPSAKCTANEATELLVTGTVRPTPSDV